MDGQFRKGWRLSWCNHKGDKHIHRCFYDLKTKLMPVSFKPKSFVVEVQTNADPVESWLETQDEIIDLLQSENEEMHLDRFHFLELLRNMMPDLETAKKMAGAMFYCSMFY